jgi:CheY-like chemotaxis protein
VSAVPHSHGPQASPALPRILIVDDSEPTVRALAALLGGARFAATTTYRGADALNRARAGERFEACIVDVHLPDISGLVVSQQLRDLLGPDVPILVLSGDTSMPVLNSLPHVGATYFFSKPVNAKDLLEKLKEWVAGSNASR